MKPEILFLVSPNFGLLDNWLPVFWELKKRRTDATLTALFPKAEILADINPAEVTARLGEQLFDGVIFRSRAGFWVYATSLKQAQELSKASPRINLVIGKVKTALRLADARLPVPWLTPIADIFLAPLTRMLTGESHIPLGAIGKATRAICFDIFAKTKPDCRIILDRLPNVPRFSQFHGVAISDYDGLVGGDYDSAYRTYTAIAYLSSEHERAAYAKNYGLKDSEMKTVGVPRYESGWIEKIRQDSKNDLPPSWDKYLFVVSRPATGDFFSREKKKRAMESIKKLAFEDLHCKVVIKLRLSEYAKKDGVYEEVLGEDRYGKDWIYSSSHPLVLGKNCLFAITFYSGVAIDMLALGVATVQMADPKPRNKRDHIMEYKKRGLVLGAETYEELKAHARAIIDHKETAIATLRKNFNEYFSPGKHPISTIADDISRVL